MEAAEPEAEKWKTEQEKPQPMLELNFTGTLPLQVKQKFKGVIVTMNEGDSIISVTAKNKKVVKPSFSGNTITLKAGKKAGKTTVTVTLASKISKTFTVKVQKKKVKAKKIRVASKKLNLTVNESFDLAAVLTPISAPKLTFKSSNKKVASVSRNGLIRAKKKGKAEITVKSGTRTLKVKVSIK